MISYLCNKANKINNRSIKIDIAEFESHKEKIIEEIKEEGILNIIENDKNDMNKIPYDIIKNLAEILTLYDEFECFYEIQPRIRMTENDLKNLNKDLNQVDFIPKLVKASIIHDNLQLFKHMLIHEIDAREHLVYYREIIMHHFLENENLTKSLLMMKYYYIKKNNKFVRKQVYRFNDLKRGNFFQTIVSKILTFYFHNKLYYENKRKINAPIIGYKNNIPVLNPKFFAIKEPRIFTFTSVKI
jgi:hypothetical protein